MKSVKRKILSVVLIALFAIVVGIAGAFAMNRTVNAAAQTETQTSTEEPAYVAPDEGSSYAAINRPTFYTGSMDEEGELKFTAVPGGAYSTSFTYSTTQSQYVQLKGYDPATMTYALSNTTYMAAVEDATAKTLTVTVKNGAPATTAAAPYKITIKLRPDETSGNVENTWGDLFQDDKVYEIAVSKLSVNTPTFWQVVKTTDESGDATTKDERVTGEYIKVPYSASESYKFKVKGYNANLFTPSVSQTAVTYVVSEDGTEVTVTYPAAVAVGQTRYFRLTLKDTSSMEWKDGTGNTAKDYTIEIEKKVVKVPSLVGADTGADHVKTLNYNGGAQTVKFSPAYSGELTFSMPSNVSGVTGSGSFDATTGVFNGLFTKAATYTVTVSLADTAKYMWEDNATPNTVYTVIMNKGVIKDGAITLNYYAHDSGRTTVNKVITEVTGGGAEFSHTIEYDTSDFYYSLAGVNDSMITVSGYSTSYYLRANSFDNANNRYNFFVDYYYDSSYTNPIGTHYFHIAPTTDYTWENGTSGTKTVSITVAKRTIAVPKIISGEISTDVNVTASANGIRSNKDTEINFLYDGTQKKAYLNNYVGTIIQYNSSSPNSNYFTEESYQGSTHYYFYYTNQGTYTLYLKLSNTTYYQWEDAATNTSATRTYVMRIVTKPVEDLETYNFVTYGKDSSYATANRQPVTLTQDGVNYRYVMEYPLADNYFAIEGLKGNYLSMAVNNTTVVYGAALANSNTEYRFRIRTSAAITTYNVQLTPKTGFGWSDGKNDTRYLYIQVTRHTIDFPSISNGVWLDGENYRNYAGNVVTDVAGKGIISKTEGVDYFNKITYEYNNGSNVFLYLPYVVEDGVQLYLQNDGFRNGGDYSISNYDTNYNGNGVIRFWYNALQTGNKLAYLRIKLPNTSQYRWPDGSTGVISYYLEITYKKLTGDFELLYFGSDSARSDLNKQIVVNKTQNSKDLNYTYHTPYSDVAQYFAVTDFVGYVSLTVNNTTYLDNQGIDTTRKYAMFYIKGGQNPYTCVYTITPSANYCWADGATGGRSVTVVVDKIKVEVPKLAAPEEDTYDLATVDSTTTKDTTVVTYTYDGATHPIYVSGYQATAIITATFTTGAVGGTTGSGHTISNNAAGISVGQYHWYSKNVGMYTYTFALANTYKYEWADTAEGGSASRVFRLQINKKKINLDTHPLNYYGNDSGYSVNNKQQVMDTVLSAGLSYSTYYTANYYYCFALDGLYDVNLKENLVSVAIPASNGSLNYNNNYMVNDGANSTTGEWRFRIEQYHATSYGGIIRQCLIQFTPTSNYCWDDSDGKETRNVYISIIKRPVDVPVLNSLIGDEMDEDGEVVNGYGATYNATTRTAYYVYQEGVELGMYIGGYSAFISRTASTNSTVKNENNGYTFKASNVNTYTLTMTVTNSTFYEWNDDVKTGSRVFTIIISKAKVAIPTLIYTDDAYGTAEKTGATITDGYNAVVEFRAKNHYFNILGYDNTRMAAPTLSNPNSMAGGWKYDSDYNGYVIYLTQGSGNNRVGKVTFTVSPDANHEWDVKDGSEGSARQFIIEVKKARITLPEFEFADAGSGGFTKTLTYNGTQQTATLINSSQDYFTVTKSGSSADGDEWQVAAKKYLLKVTNAGSYTLTLAPVDNYEWDDATATGNRIFTVIVERMALEAPKLAYYGADGEYKAGSRVTDSDTGFIRINYNPNIPQSGSYYFTFEGYSHITSAYFDIGVSNNTNYMTTAFDDANSRIKLSVIHYSTDLTRTAGWTFYLTPKANYCWKTASSTVDFAQKPFVVYVDKLEIALPTVYVEEGDNFANNYKTVTYNGQNQRISFLNFANSGISHSLSHSTMTVDWTNEAWGEEQPDGSKAKVSVRNFYAKNAADYSITLSISNTNYYKWENNATNPVYHLVIDRQEVEIPKFYRLDSNDAPITDPDDPDYIHQDTRQAYVSYSTLTGYKFVLQNYAGGTYYSASVGDANLKTALTGTDYFLTLAAGVNRKDYTLTVTPNSNYKWKGEGYDAKVYTITVEQVKVSLISLYDPIKGEVIEGNRYTAVYNAAMQNIVFMPTISAVNNNHFNYSTDVIAVYNTYAGNESYRLTPSAGTKITIDGVTVDSSYMAQSTVGTYDYRVRLISDNYVWDNGNSWNTYRQYFFIIAPKEIPRLEYYYNDVKYDSNTATDEYSRSTRAVYCVVPEGSTADLNEYSVSLRNTSYFPSYSQSTYDGRPAFLVRVAAFAPTDYYFTITTINGNIMWTGEGVRTASEYHFVVTKATLVEPVFNLIESAATEEDPTAMKDTPIESGHTVEYTGNYYRIKFTGAHSSEVSIGGVSGAPALSDAASTGASWSNATMECIRTAVNANTYTVRVSVRDTSLYQWAGGLTYRDYTFIISRKQVTAPVYTFTGAAYNSSDVQVVDGDTYSTVYNTANQFFKLSIDETDAVASFDASGTSNSSYKLSASSSQWVASKYYYFYQQYVANYTVKVNLSSNYCWIGGSTDPLTYHFNITKMEVTAPSFDEDWLTSNGYSYTLNGYELSVVYTGTQIPARIKDYDTDKVALQSWYIYNTTNHSSYSPTENPTDKTISFRNCVNVGSSATYPYNIIIKLKDTTNYQWVGGGTTSITFQMHIIKQDVVAPNMYQVTVQNGDDGDYDVETLISTNQLEVTYDVNGYDVRIKDVDKNQVNFAISAVNWNNGSITGVNLAWADGSTEGNYHLVTAGTYTIYVRLKNTSCYQWAGSTNTDQREYKVIIKRQEISLPSLEDGVTQTDGSFKKTVVYDGNPQTLKILTSSADYLMRTGGTNFSDLGDPDKTIPGCILYPGAVNVGTYSVILGFNSTGNANLNYIYANETQAQTFTLEITPKPIAVPYIINGDGLNDNGSVDGTRKTVIYTADTVGRSMLVRGYNDTEMSYSWNGTTIDSYVDEALNELILKATAQNVASYSLTFSLTNNYSWSTTGAIDRTPKTLTLRITQKEISAPTPYVTANADYISTVEQSAIRKDINLTFNGEQQGFTVTFAENVELGVGISGTVTHTVVDASQNLHSYTALNATSYWVRFYIYNTTNYKWADGQSDVYRYIYIIIKPKTVSIPTIVANDEYDDSTSRWTGSYKYVDFNTGNRYIVIDGYDSNLMNYSKTSSLNLLATVTPAPVEGEGDDETATTTPTTPAKNYLTFYAVAVNTYTVTFTLSHSSNYIWETGNTNGQSLYLVIQKKAVTVPTIEGVNGNTKEVVFNGANQSMVLSPWDANEVQMYDKTGTLQVSATNPNEFLAMNYLNNTGYMVRVRLTNYSNYRWADNGEDDRYYYLKITPQAVDLPTIVEEDDKATATYDHAKGIKTVTFNTYSQSIKVSVPYGKVKYPTYPSGMSLKDDSKWATSNEIEYQATNATTYTIYFYLDSANYKWKDDVAYNNAKTLQFVINKIKVKSPAIVVEDLGDNGTIIGNQKTVEYTAHAQYMNIYAPFEFVSLTTYNSPGRDTDDNWKKNDTLNVWATNVNTYTFRFNLKNTNNMEWDNQTNGSIDMLLKIDIKRMAMPAIEGYGSNMTQTVSYETDANGNPVTQYMYLTNIVDENILTVSSYTSYSSTSYGTYRLNYVYDAENQRYVCSANDVFYTTGINNYSITIRLANSNYRWTDGTTTDKTYNLRIERKAIDLPAYYEVSAGKDEEGKDTEILSPINSGKAIFEYDGNDKNVRLIGVLNNIINYSDNSIATSSNGNKNGNLLESYDPKTNTLNYAASHVYLNYYNNTIDYTITLTLKNTKNYVWNDGNNGTGAKYFYVRINRKQITQPRIEGNTGTNMYYLDVPFNNQPQSFTLTGVDQNWMTATSYNTTTFPIEFKDGNKLVGDAEKDVRDNYVTIALKDTLNTSWTTSSSYDVGNKAYHLRIQVVRMVVPSVVGNNTQKYTSDKYTFQYRDVWNSDYMTYTLNDIKNMSTDYDADTKILTVTVAANAPITSYYVTFTMTNYNNMQWNTSYSTSNKSVYIYLQKAQVTIPTIDGNGTSLKKSVVYTGKDQKIALKDYLRDVNADGTAKWMTYTLTSTAKFNGGAGVWNTKDETLDFSAQNVGTYTVRVSTNAFCTFTDGSTYKDFNLEITKAIYDSPFFVDDGVGTTTATVKTFTFNFTLQNAVISNIINDVNITDQIVWWRDITGYANGTADDHRLQIKWDKDSNSATVGAQYIGTYWIRFQIADNAWANARWSTTTSNYIDYRIVVNRAVLTIPTVVRTGLAANESISGRYKYSTYNGSFIVAQFKDIDATYMTWQDLTNYAGKDDAHKAVFTYDDDTKVLTLKAKYVATYTFRVRLKDYTNTYWSGYSSYSYTWDCGLVINKFNHAYPVVASGVSTSVTYTGTDIPFTLQNVVQGTDKYEVTLGTMKEVSWDQGLLTLSAKDVGTYTVKVSIIDTDNSSWTSYTSRTFNFVISRKALSAELSFSSPVTEVNDAIDQGSSSWAAGVPVYLNVNISGLNPIEGETVGINAYWYNNNNTAVTTALTASGTNRYAIPTTLTKGTYYAVITHAATADNYTLGTYKLKFVINSDPAKFTENDLVWQYSVGGNSKIEVSGSHNTPGTALDLTYAGAAYQFSITLNDAELQKLNVRLVSYSGDTTATDYKADTYRVSVTIGAYDSSYYFPQTTYNLYYTIAKAKFNMSQVKWDYSDPYTYDETAKSVEILGTSLPAGLTVASYSGNNSETNATEGKARGYTTGVAFTVSSQNYVIPLQSDPSTYTGDFSWTCEWQINKAPIDVHWKPIVKVDEDNRIFNIPVLIDGGEKVTYSYEKWIVDDSYDEGGYWKQTDKVTYSTVEVTYRVTPKLTDGSFNTVNYAANYKLVPFEDEGTVAHEFTVGGEQIPVVFKVLINGKTGTQFPYTGKAYVATISVEQDDEERITVVENSVQVTYTRLSDGTNMGSTAPIAVGKYKVVITLSYNIKDAGDSANINSKVEDEFEIIKGTLDTSMLVWKIDHTGGKGKCTYDASQGKWVDIYGAEVSKFVYDGNPYTLTLEGTDKLYGLTISSFTGLSATDKGDYEAKFIMSYDTNSWEAPDFSNTLKWSISVAEIVLDTAYWNYANAFVYTLEDGSAVKRTVELQSLPKQLTDMVTAGTATVTYTGNTGSLAATYTAKVTINITNPNYTVVFPETLKDTLTWSIEQRKLTIPEESGQWAEFDGKSHDLMVEVCGADSDWADFYDVSIRYSRDGSTYMNYSGYKDVLTDAYDAWFYELTLTIKNSINSKTATNAVWENESADKQIVRFSVGKLTVTVTGWKGNYENTTAMTDYDAIVQPDMLGYTITDADGKEYTKEEAKQLGGGITLTVKPYVVSALTNNITLAYVDDNSKSYDYVTQYVGLEWLVNPELKADTADYDGTKHTFVIDNWEYYSDYLEFTSITDDDGNKLESASLEQTKAGTYSVYLKIKDTANASWKTTDGTIERKRIVELSFTINAKMVTLPTISDYEYTGSAINLANVLDKSLTDFAELSGNVSATNVGKYELKLKFKDADSCVWNDGSSDEKTISWNINQRILSTPDAGGWTVFDGEVHNLVKDCGYGDDWNTYFDVTVEYSADGDEFETFEGYETDKNYTAYKSGVYKIVFTIKEALNNGNENVVWSNFSTEAQTATVAVSNYGVTVTGWNANKEQSTVKLSDGTTASTKFFEYIIRNSETNAIVTTEEVLTAGVGKGFTIELAVKSSYTEFVNIIYSNDSYKTYFFTTEKLSIDKPEFRFSSYEFNATARTFEIVDWATKYNKYLVMDQPAEYLKQTNAGNYSIVLSFKENSVAAWADGSSDPYTLNFSITVKDIVKPALANAAYTGSEINILTQYIAEYGDDYIEIKSGDKYTNAGNYKLVLGLKYPESTKWQGGDNSDLTLNWSITQTKLVAPANSGKWTVFDAANHDLLELCNVPANWSNYYTAKIEYSADGVTYSDFSGNFGYNAGSYKITFHIKDDLNPDGASNVVWANTENTDNVEVVIAVNKLEVKVIGWNENANDSTVKLESGSLPASITSYVFKDAEGKEVTEAEVLASAQGVKFSKELVVSDTDNVKVEYETAGLKRYYFVMSVHKMYIPQLSETGVEYDGKLHTFLINDWDLYTKYVEIVTAESSSLSQQDAGTYTVKLHIKDAMVSTWQDGSTDDVTLTFEITQIIVDGRWDTKNIPNTFVVTGTYPVDNNSLVSVTYTDKDGKTADPANLKEGETYTATVALNRSYTTNYKLDENIELTAVFTMPINYTRLNLPTIKDATRPYNGKAQTFQIGYWATIYQDYLDMEGSLTQTDTGKYEVTLSFKEGVHATWQDGSMDPVTLKFEITGVTVKAAWDISGEAPVLDTSDTVYAGGKLPEKLIGYVFKDDKGNVVEANELVYDTTYYVTASISADYRLNFTFASDVQKVYVFFIRDGKIEPATLKKLAKPELIGNSKEYTGAELTFEIENWDTVYKNYLDLVEGSLTQTDAGEYSIKLRFKDGAAAIWESGGMEDVVLKFTVAQRVVEGEWIFEEEGLEQPYFNLAEEGFELPEGLLAYVLKDANGKEVTAIKANVTYYITVSVTDVNYKFADGTETEKVFRLNTDGTLTEVVVKRMTLPEFVQASIIYDGTAHVFEVADFDEISSFVEVTGDSLTQTNVGKYKITFHIKDTTVSTWVGGTTGDYSITFEVTARTTALPVAMPSMADAKLTYTGSAITFAIADWAETYQDIIELSGDDLTQTTVGEYSVTLKIKDTSLFIWENGKLEDVTLTFEIVKAQVEGEWLLGDDVPYFAPDESTFGAYPEDMIEYTITDKDGNVIDFKNTETCVTYYMTATIVNDNFEFAEGVQTTFAFRYTEGNVLFAVEVELLDMPEFVQSSIEYDGEEHTFEVKDWAFLGQYLELSGASLTQTNVGEYSVTFTIIDTTLATWQNGTTRTVSLRFAITERTSGNTELALPAMEKAEYTYDGTEHTFAIKGWADLADKVVLDGDSLTQTAVGTYTVTLRIKNSVLYVWADGSDTATVTFEVKAILIDAQWIYKDIDVPYLEDVSLDIVRYEVTDVNGNAADPYNAVEGVNYYITAYITDYNYTFEDGLESRFVYRLDSEGDIIPVEKTTIGEIKFVESSIEYDGEAHTFEIVDWDFLSIYFDMSGSKLTQTRVGRYSVTLVIIDTTLASFENSSARSLTLRFEITERTSETISLELPVIEIAEYTYDGTEHTFVIEGWEDLAGKVVLEGDSLTQTEVGTYTTTLRIKNSILYVWADGSSTATVSFAIKAIPLKAEWIFSNTDVPYISFLTLTAVGYSSRNDVAVHAEEMVRYEITDYYGNVINEDDTVSGVNYYITAIITDPNYAFEEGFENRFVYRISTDGEIIPVPKTTIGDIKFVADTITYDGETHTFEIADWAALEPYVQIIGSLTKTEIGEYKVTIHIIDKTLATWENGTALDKTLLFYITEDELNVSLEHPVIEIESKEFNGTAQTFQISNWSELKKYVKIKEGLEELTQTDVGTYTITLQIVSERFTWKTDSEADSTADLVLKFKIGKRKLAGTWDRFKHVPQIVLNGEDLPEDLLVAEITDRNGLAVDSGALKVGETYLVTYAVSEQYDESYTLPVSLRAQHFRVGADGNTDLLDAFPAEQEREEADNTLTKIVFAVVIILVLFLVTIIICFVYIIISRKKKAKQDAENAKANESEGEDEQEEEGLDEDANSYGTPN